MELLKLLDVRLRTMWCHDERGRITVQNRPMGSAAPRLVMSRCAAGSVWRVGPAVTADQIDRIAALAAADDDWRADTPPFLDDVMSVLAADEIDGGPNFRPTDTMTPAGGRSVVVTATNCHVLEPLMADWLVDVGTRDPVVATIVDGAAVSVCTSARIGPLVHEAGVETHPDHRGAGHGLEAVARWRTEVERLGALPLYCTEWSNTASKRLAAAAGFEHYATDLYVL